MQTAHWISLVLGTASLALALAQAVFWFEIRGIHKRIDRAEERIDEQSKSFRTCQFQHDGNSATKQDVVELKGAISAVHRRIDELYRLLLDKQGRE